MKNSKLPSLVVLMILTLITGSFWIIFNLYRVFTSAPAPVVEKEVISQIDPKIDMNIINDMKARINP